MPKKNRKKISRVAARQGSLELGARAPRGAGELRLRSFIQRRLQPLMNQIKQTGLSLPTKASGGNTATRRIALFVGADRTEKITAATVLADELNRPLFRVELSRVVSRYIGETEKNLGRVLDQAAQAGAILFFDEADALLGKRTEVKDSPDRYAYHQRATILVLMKNYAGLTILSISRMTPSAAFKARRCYRGIRFAALTSNRGTGEKGLFMTRAAVNRSSRRFPRSHSRKRRKRQGRRRL
jgi:SpoVK/Ycf46/Vps4 family AAA+-type ATPase